jgi:polyribonucleotide nucleotidyltransferase
MMEGGGKEIMEKNVGTAIEGALKEVERIQEWQERIIKEIGKPKRELLFGEETQDVRAAGEERARARRAILEKGVRADGRGVDKLRPLFAQKGGFLQGVHGSGLFYRGGTHVLSVLTRDTRDAAQNIETIERRGEKKYFLHHYNSFPFGSGETGRLGSNRRAIGHGALVERALASVVPAPDAYPYTLRLVSEALSSDGSTSMASVCAGTLALQDGGVPIAAPVAGVAMGLVDSTILTDISGAEDHIGDMDLKVAGTRQGITALQMDVKNEGVSPAVIADALTKARVAREKILEMMR